MVAVPETIVVRTASVVMAELEADVVALPDPDPLEEDPDPDPVEEDPDPDPDPDPVVDAPERMVAEVYSIPLLAYRK